MEDGTTVGNKLDDGYMLRLLIPVGAPACPGLGRSAGVGNGLEAGFEEADSPVALTPQFVRLLNFKGGLILLPGELSVQLCDTGLCFGHSAFSLRLAKRPLTPEMLALALP